MPQLREIRNALAELGGRRRRDRWAAAYAALGIIWLWCLAAVFALDVTFQLSAFQRVALFLVAAACGIWAMRRFVLPFLAVRESESQLALFVERQHGIDSDLVAALQFSRPEAANWGSPQLESAVITRIAERMPQLDVFRGLRYDIRNRRLKLLGVTVVAVIVVALAYSQHLSVFFERLLLSTRPYPSDTKIETISVNGELALRWHPIGRVPRTVKSAQGRPVQFMVQANGELPERGFVKCSASRTADARTLELRRISAAEFDRLRNEILRSTTEGADIPPTDPHAQLYLATLPQLLEDIEYSIHLGDTSTEAGIVRMMALPMAEVDIQVTPPDYARGAEIKPGTSRHVAVVEGSRVRLAVRSLNKKPLQSVSVRFRIAGQSSEMRMSKQDNSGLAWQLDSPDTPLARIEQEIRYEIQVVDIDGLELESPLQGIIQLMPDRLPAAAIQTVHRVVLPGARPIVEFRVTDDYGIQALRLQTQVQRPSYEADANTENALTMKVFEIPFEPRPLIGASVRHRGQYELDLSPLGLVKGDRLKLTLEAIDYRGATPGRPSLTEPLLLEVTDEAGVLAAITEVDEQSEQRLGETIQQQLGVGTTP